MAEQINLPSSAPLTPLPAQPPLAPKSNLNIFIGVLIFLLGIFVGLTIGKTRLFSAIRIPYLGVKPTPTPFTTPKPTAEAGDPTADWKTYTNTEMGIEFKYPSTYLITNESIRPYLNRNITWRYNSMSYLDCKGDCPVINTTEKTTLGEKPATKITGYIGSIGGNIPQSYITYEVVSGTKYFIFSMQALPFVMVKDEATKYDPYTTQQIKPEDQIIFDQILSTFKFTGQSPTVSPTPAVPPNWIRHTFNTYGLMIYTPDDWQSSITDYPADSTSLIKFWKKSSPTIVPIQLDIKSNWDNTGNAQTQPKNFMVDGSIPAYRMDAPTKTQQTLERYQTNVYFEHGNKVYVFECVHNWTQDYLDTCNAMLSALKFVQ